MPSRHISLHQSFPRGKRRVPSTGCIRASLPAPHSREASGSAFPIESGSDLEIGPNLRTFKKAPKGKKGPDTKEQALAFGGRRGGLIAAMTAAIPGLASSGGCDSLG